MPRTLRVSQAYHIRNVVVAGEVVTTAQGVGVRDIQELDERVPDVSYSINNWGSLCRDNDPEVMSECEKWPVVPDCAELRIQGVVQKASSLEFSLYSTSRGNLVGQSSNLKRSEKSTAEYYARVTYLLRGVYDIAISEPAAYRTELGLVRKRILEVNGACRRSFPLNELITLGKPLSVNVGVELDLMGTPVV